MKWRNRYNRKPVTKSPPFNFILAGEQSKKDASMLGQKMEKKFAQLMKMYQANEAEFPSNFYAVAHSGLPIQNKLKNIINA
jgi:hypothetical protein